MKSNEYINRNYGIDLLRIVSMSFVLVLHLLGAGGVLKNTEMYSLKYESMWYIELLAYCAVNCYALISGYVGAFSKYRFSNFILLWFRVLFYTVSITVIMKIFFSETVGIKQIICAFFPVYTGQYWYFTAYFILFLFMPLLNHIIRSLEQKKLLLCLCIIIIAISVINPFFDIVLGDMLLIKDGYSALWLMIMYLVGGYIKKYGLLSNCKTKLLLALYFLSAALTLIIKFLIQIITKSIFGQEKFDNLFVSYISITVLASSVFLFLFFERISIKKQSLIKLISIVSPLSFSVYIIHAQPLLYDVFIKDNFQWIADKPLPVMLLLLFCIVIAVFLSCCLVDFIRNQLFKLLHIKEKLISIDSKAQIRINKSFNKKTKN